MNKILIIGVLCFVVVSGLIFFDILLLDGGVFYNKNNVFSSYNEIKTGFSSTETWSIIKGDDIGEIILNQLENDGTSEIS